jgi:hypothetical protein
MRQKRAFIPRVLLWAVAAVAACGGDSSTGPKNSGLTAAEAQQVAVAIFTEVSKALSSVGASSPAPASQSVAAAPTTFSSPCTNGGTISGSFTFTSTLDSQGTGTVDGSMTITPSGCKVSTGSRIIEVSGSLNFTFSMAFTKGAQSGNFVFHGGGSFTWTGGSCTMDYTVTLTPQGKETISGTVCGETINVST